jgi:serine phosphatase RsbU (regulator of sigma subunit)
VKNITYIKDWPHKDLADELLHFQEVASLVLPRKEDLPVLSNIDYFAAVEPYRGCVGGDHIVVVNFDKYKIGEKIKAAEAAGNTRLARKLKKNLDAFGILIADVAGHMVTDNAFVGYLHGAFKMGARMQLKYEGEITAELFEMMNTEVYYHIQPDFLKVKPYTTLLYAEIHNDGRIRYVSAGHPQPIIFSHEYNRVMTLSEDLTRASTPLGVLPSDYHVDTDHFQSATVPKSRLPVNDIHLLSPNDIMVLHTDGLSEQKDGELNFVTARLEAVLREAKNESARDIWKTIRKELRAFATIQDDVTVAVVKRK